VSREPFRAAPKITEKDIVTLFPQEWMRDPASPFLTSGYHDVPWEEPELLRACVRKAWKLKRHDSQLPELPALSTLRIPRS
jgi:hypothetical protein